MIALSFFNFPSFENTLTPIRGVELRDATKQSWMGVGGDTT